MIYAAGVDVGSTQTKSVVIDESRDIVARSLIATGANGPGDGRYKVTFGNAQITEITCHARGAHFLFPSTRTVVDIGGQDTKAIRVGPLGDVLDFSMNDKCAAG